MKQRNESNTDGDLAVDASRLVSALSAIAEAEEKMAEAMASTKNFVGAGLHQEKSEYLKTTVIPQVQMILSR